MAEIQKPSDQFQNADAEAGKPDALDSDRKVSGNDMDKSEKLRTIKFSTVGKMSNLSEGDSLDETRARQSAPDNPLTIDLGNGT
jgi:hypothetical protein